MAVSTRVRRRFMQYATRKQRIFRERINPLDRFLSDKDIKTRLRFTRETIYLIYDEIKHLLARPTKRSKSLSPMEVLCIALRFYAEGSFFVSLGDHIRCSRATAGRCVQQVTNALVRVSSRHIKMPSTEALDEIKANFYEKAGFPNVIGAIDGTLIEIRKPWNNAAEYYGRKNRPMLNVLAVCLPDNTVTYVNAKWPGSVHDSRIFNESKLKQFLERTDCGVLLGDSGFPLRRYLLTPFMDPGNNAEERFNDAHAETRVLIECTFGILKNRFQCLMKPLRVIGPLASSNVIVACIVLNNIAIKNRDLYQPLHDGRSVEVEDHEVGDNSNDEGRRVRQRFVDTYFN